MAEFEGLLSLLQLGGNGGMVVLLAYMLWRMDKDRKANESKSRSDLLKERERNRDERTKIHEERIKVIELTNKSIEAVTENTKVLSKVFEVLNKINSNDKSN